MNENPRTIAFLLVAALVAAATFALPLLMKTADPLGYDESFEDLEGTLLFPKFKDPLAATSLDIVRYNEESGDRSQFEVAQVDNIWSIPSHENYPADAKDQLAAAAADLIDLKILSVAGDSPADHALYGVLDPTNQNLKPGEQGVGMKVVMKDSKGESLVSMIVGKDVAESPGLHYVRRTGQDVVLTVKFDPGKLTTDFGAWIEKDLLKLNSWDLNKIEVEDYSVDEAQRHILQSDKFTLGYEDSADPKWKLLANITANKEGNWEDVKLGADEQLNTKKLDEMKTALDDLKIVDVTRKPAGLSADLAADKEFMNNREAVASLMQRGFFPANVDGKPGIYSNEGEIRVLMNDGVEYVLRFGGIADSNGDQADTDQVNRYLFITAQFNDQTIPKPELLPLPSEKADEKKADQPNEKKADEAAAEKSAEEDDAKKADLEKQRDEIEKVNRRLQDEYNEKVAAGKEKVAELNARFADWYYIISESVYDKIHLRRKDLIEPKGKEGNAGQPIPGATNLPIPSGAIPPDVFRQLQSGGAGTPAPIPSEKTESDSEDKSQSEPQP